MEKIIYQELSYLRTKIVIRYLLKSSDFIIFCNIREMKKKFLFNFKNEIKKLECKSSTLNAKFINIEEQGNDLRFLDTHSFAVFINKFQNFMLLISLLETNNISFFYLHKNSLSHLVNYNKFIYSMSNFHKLNSLHYIVFRYIFRILLLIIYFIRFLITSFLIHKKFII